MRKQFSILLLAICCFSQQLTFAAIKVPFRFKNGLIIADFNLNGKNKIPFVFDTGASTTVIDSTAAQALKMKAEGRQTSIGASGPVSLPVIYGQQIELSKDETVNLTQCVVVNLQSLRERNGEDFFGIIGYDILKNYYTFIDYDRKELVFDTKLPDVSAGYSKIPFTFGNSITIPQINLGIALKSGKKLEGSAFFDSGAALTLLVNSPFKKDNLTADVIGKTITSKSRDLSKETLLEEAAIESVQLGEFKFSSLPISLSSDHQGVSSYKGYLGILGNKIISRFNVVLDYREKNIYLKPNQLHNAAFDFPMSGLRFKKINGKIFVGSVTEGSPAAVKGFKEEQAIYSVDGYKGSDLDKINKLLQQEGKTIVITISSNGEHRDVELKLQRLL
ncbi:MAG: aspartyl protease family protein [Chitinophagaceae bacterium]|nr:aspartyl protease family protein [Chitinophagaceae bacterium]